MVHDRLILVEGGDDRGGDDVGNDDDSGRGTETPEVKVDIVAHENENGTRTLILISSYLNIALFIKTYNVQTTTNQVHKPSTDQRTEETEKCRPHNEPSENRTLTMLTVRSRATTLIRSYLNIVFFMKTYNIQTTTNQGNQAQTDRTKATEIQIDTRAESTNRNSDRHKNGTSTAIV